MSSDPVTLSKALKEEALRLGFHFAGITHPDPPPHLGTYERWLGRGHHADMAYLATDRARDRRADPQRILPECRSILCLGIHYPIPSAAADSDHGPLSGRVASYAWGDDYHDVLPERMRALVQFLEAQVGKDIPHRWYTDTGPILERDLAQRAGLGWIGKNTCLINPRHGSYFLLAEILLGIELPADPPFDLDHCGSCNRCIQACPTDCILPDRTIDAGRCISYLTIELKGPIPLELRPDLQNWVFGCDICQEVCPWNLRFASAGYELAFAPRDGVPQPDLIREMRLDQQSFNRKFKQNPAKRPKRRGYLRNVAIALGNSKDTQGVPVLRAALFQDEEPLVRGHAAWALGNIGGPDAVKALEYAAQEEADPYVLEEIQAALAAATEG